MTSTTTVHAPEFSFNMSASLLSTPIFKYDADYLMKIVSWLEEKILDGKYRKYPHTIMKIKEQIKLFMGLYERAKILEEQTKEKTFIRAHKMFYRYGIRNRADRRTFEKLNDRRKTSQFDRKNSAF